MTDNLPVVTGGGDGGNAVASELADIAAVARSDPARYRRSLAGRRLALLRNQIDGTPLPARNTNLERKEEILALMRQGRSGAYYRGPHALALQAELRAIYESEAAGDTAPVKADTGKAVVRADTGKAVEDWRPPVAQVKAALPLALVAEWEKSGGFEMRLTEVQNRVMSIVRYIATTDKVAAGEFQLSFGQLPLDVKTVCWNLISLPARSGFTLAKASQADVARFRTDAIGDFIVTKVWGIGQTPKKLAILRAALQTVKDRVSPANWKIFDKWTAAISAPEWVGICAALTGELR